MARLRSQHGCAERLARTLSRRAAALLLALVVGTSGAALADDGELVELAPIRAVPAPSAQPQPATPADAAAAASPAPSSSASSASAGAMNDEGPGPIRAIDVPAAANTGEGGVVQQRGLAGIADEPSDPALLPEQSESLFLEVYLNGHPTNLIGEFLVLPGNRFALRVKEMRDLGLRVPEGAADDDIIVLDDLAAEWSYDESRQRIDIRLPEKGLKPEIIDLSGRAAKEDLKITPSGTGAVLNYTLLASARSEGALTAPVLDGITANLEGWIYSPLGTVFASAFVRSDGLKTPRAVRLETKWRYVDLKRAIDYTVGDVITRGPEWSRSLRMGGVRISRSFRLRPDIVTVPLPTLSGSAAVPTTIDVYVNNIRVHSGKVRPGPFEITNIPAISSAGVARLVMRDAAGREIVSEKRFFVAPQLLRADMLEFSVEAGVPRRNFGIESFDYDWRNPGIVASLRYGLSDRITLQAHGEAGRRLLMAGGGADVALFDHGVLSLAGAVSQSPKGTGFLAHATLHASLLGFNVNARYTRTFGNFEDLAGSAAGSATPTGTAVISANGYPEEVASLALGRALPWGGSASLNLLHVVRSDGERSDTLGVSYSQTVFGDASLYFHVFSDLKELDAPNFSAGLTMPLGGGKGTVSASGTYDVAGRWRASLSYDKPLAMHDGAVGWKARVTYGDLKSLQGSLAWRSSVATLRGTAMRMNDATLLQASVDGAIVLADGALFAANRISDAFAVVNAGAAGVKVRHENRVVGTTRGDGRLLVPSLRSLQRNKISIDAETLPVDALVESDKAVVVPQVRAGVVVNFNVRRLDNAALVSFVDAGGRPIVEGSEVHLKGVEEVFVVGYDGETFLQGLKKRNEVRIITPNGECRASFDFTPPKEGQAFIGPVKCLP